MLHRSPSQGVRANRAGGDVDNDILSSYTEGSHGPADSGLVCGEHQHGCRAADTKWKPRDVAGSFGALGG